MAQWQQSSSSVQPYGSYSAPITVQPGQPPSKVGSAGAPLKDNWMEIPQQTLNCPPGLEYLTSIDQLLVHQKLEMLEVFTGFETANKYSIKNSLDQKVYWAVEDTDCCTRNCCGPSRPFEMNVLDNHMKETIEVSAPPGNVIGTVDQDLTCCIPEFSIKDQSGSTVLRVEGSCSCKCCADVNFKVVTIDGTQVGEISRKWKGFVRAAFTDSDHFGINFPLDLDVRVKATLLGCLFLIDYMFFEKP